MARRRAPRFVCQSCGARSSQMGRASANACGGWNTIVEEGAPAPIGARRHQAREGPAASRSKICKTEDEERRRAASTGIAEFDRVTGGGLVPGSALLVGGDPGVGKSTLILQALACLRASAAARAVYISGEEAMAQVRLRAARMELADAPVALGSATCVEDILSTLEAAPSARHRRHQFHPDDLDIGAGSRARHHRAGAHRLVRSGALRQSVRRRAAARRPRHQGRPDRRPQGGRASGRCGALFRRRARPSFPRPARGEEPLRPHRRNRRVRDDRQRASPKSPIRRRCSSATATGTSPGTAVFAGLEGTRPLLVEIQALVAAAGLRHAAPRGGRLGYRAGLP